MEGKRLARSQRGEEPWRCSFRFDGHRNEKQRLGRLARRDKRISVIEEGNGGAVKGILLCPEIEGLCVPVLSARVLAGRTSERTSERANERTSERANERTASSSFREAVYRSNFSCPTNIFAGFEREWQTRMLWKNFVCLLLCRWHSVAELTTTILDSVQSTKEGVRAIDKRKFFG